MNIRDRRLELHLTLEEVGEKVGVGKSTVRKWEAGAIKNMGRDKIVALAKALKMSPLEIIDPDHKLPTNIVDEIKETVMELSTPRQNKVYDFAKRQLNEQNGKAITIGRATAAGNPLCGETQDINMQRTISHRDEIPRGADEVIDIAGDSMEPLLPEGSQQFIHHQPVPDSDGQIMIVRIKDEGVTCKKVYREKNKIRLVSVNDKYKDMIYPAEDVKCIGKVILK